MEEVRNSDIIIKKGVKLIVECIGFNHEAKGVCKISGIKDEEYVENYPLFVDEMLPSEKGQVEITKLTSSYGFAKVVKIFTETKSIDRVNPMCKNYATCGGCNVMHLNYKAQLKFKQEMVKETMCKIGGLYDVEVLPPIGMKNPKEYRNKVQVPFRMNRYKTICGFFERDTHNVVPLTECVIQPRISTDIINFVRNLCNEYNIKGYNEINQTGLIRHTLVRMNNDLSEIMVVLVALDKKIPYQEEIVAKLTKRYPAIKSIIININKQKNNTILGEECITIYGKDTISDTLCGLKFEIGPKSFYQVNHLQTEILYQKAIEIAELKNTDILIDAYCGIGTIGLIASHHVKQLYGVEIVDEAIKNAKKNAKRNNIVNAEFVCNKAEKQIIKWKETGILADAIIVDPPRKGCDQVLLDTVTEMRIPKMVYVSCDPATLARDLKYMREKGYNIDKIQPVDMFPQSSNIENVVRLSLVK